MHILFLILQFYKHKNKIKSKLIYRKKVKSAGFSAFRGNKRGFFIKFLRGKQIGGARKKSLIFDSSNQFFIVVGGKYTGMLTAAKWLIHSLPFVFLLLKAECEVNVSITYVESAVSKGAVCLDGSPPAFHLSRGFGEGINNWLIHLEGGGWCNNVTSCLNRKSTRLGSSKYMAEVIPFSAILSNTKEQNPDFYNWNRVKVRYCDGSSFTGDVEEVDPVTNLHYRGARVWLAVMEDLLTRGMNTAENALLSGCSAGGLASILHCDSFRALLPMGTKVKCLSDAGYFIDVKDVAGTDHIKSFFNDTVSLHGSAKNLPSSCTSKKLEPKTCFFPQNAAKLIQTPLFILNAAYDHWQIRNSLAFGAPNGSWTKCKLDIEQCSSNQLEIIQNFRAEFIRALMQLGNSTSTGLFINSCYIHCQTEIQGSWFAPDSTVLGELRIAEAVGNWFYDRSPFQKIDCPYPCNPTCYHQTNNTTLVV